jgi:hypothetical protein
MTVEYKIWKVDGDVDSGFVDGAIDAIDTLDSQIDTNLTAEAMSPDIPELTDATDFGAFIENDLVPHVVGNYGCPADTECHIGIVETSSVGAGGTLGPVTDGANPFSTNPNCRDSKAAGAMVNTYSGSGGTVLYPFGDDTFEVTVIHNAIHSLLAENIDTPSDDCSQDQSKDHSLGEITSAQRVSPAQIWYTPAIASGNPPPCDNYSHNTDENADGATTSISSCTSDALATSADELGY